MGPVSIYPCFQDFSAVFDSETKRLKVAGLGSKTRKTEPCNEEELLWEKQNPLGKHSPGAAQCNIFQKWNLVCCLVKLCYNAISNARSP